MLQFIHFSSFSFFHGLVNYLPRRGFRYFFLQATMASQRRKSLTSIALDQEIHLNNLFSEIDS